VILFISYKDVVELPGIDTVSKVVLVLFSGRLGPPRIPVIKREENSVQRLMNVRMVRVMRWGVQVNVGITGRVVANYFQDF